MEPSIPLGKLLSKPLEKIDKFLFEETYKTSQQVYENRSTFLKEWHDIRLYDFLGTTVHKNYELQISEDLPSILDNAKLPMIRMAFKINDDKLRITKVLLRIEANSGGIRYQEYVRLYDISSIAIIKSLPSFPLRSFDIIDGGYYASIKEIKVYLEEIIVNNQYIKGPPDKDIYCIRPTNYDLLNMRFEERWGIKWNVHKIDSEIQKIQNKLRYNLITNKYLYKDKPLFRIRFFSFLKRFIGCLTYLIIGNKCACKIWFWSKIILFRKKLDINP